MTSIYYCSDIHLEWGALDKTLPQGDILILAGDITLASAFLPDADGHPGHEKVRKATMDLFAEAKRNFSKTFYLFGNHEPYGSNISHLRAVLSPYIKGATILEDEFVELDKDVILFGGPLWTDFNKKNPHDMAAIGAGLNDYRLITIEDRGKARRFTTTDAYRLHQKTRKTLSRVSKNHPDKRIVVATHHAPSEKGINPLHHGSALNPGYFSDLEDFIKKRPNITHWVHGHTHVQTTYEVHQCQVFSNGRGYHNYEHSAKTFETNRFFEV